MLITDNRLLRIDLGKQTWATEPIPTERLEQYLGGRGLGSRYLVDEIAPDIDPLSPENTLIFAGGLLSGTTAPTGGRYMVITKSPLTGTIASSNSGGSWGAALRKTGYLMLIIEGASTAPVTLKIDRNGVTFVDADHLWGKDVFATTEALLTEADDRHARVACIGQAGEKLSPVACIMNEKHRAAGRSGVGAVMGSKKLKAIVVSGTEKIETRDPERFKTVVKEKIAAIRAHPVTGEGLPSLGTKVLDSIINENGLYPTNNFQLATFPLVEEVNGEALVTKGYLKKKKGCFACPIACGRDTELPDGERGEGPEYESGWAFGADCGVNDLFAITKANFLCNRYGLDTITAGATIAAAMELYEKGYIRREELQDGPELRFGSSEAVVYYTRQLALREKFGDKLAEGSYRLCDSYGHPELSMSVKRQELPAYDPRGVQGQALQYATSNRGGCHVRGYMISPEILGAPEKLDTQDLADKPRWVIAFQDLTAAIDSAGLCLFTSFALNAADYADLVNAAAGLSLSGDDIVKIGERIWNMERRFNMAAGISPEEDTLPPRFLEEPLPDGPQQGAVVRLDIMLPEYYQLRGWNPDGTIPEAKLQELGL